MRFIAEKPGITYPLLARTEMRLLFRKARVAHARRAFGPSTFYNVVKEALEAYVEADEKKQAEEAYRKDTTEEEQERRRAQLIGFSAIP